MFDIVQKNNLILPRRRANNLESKGEKGKKERKMSFQPASSKGHKRQREEKHHNSFPKRPRMKTIIPH